MNTALLLYYRQYNNIGLLVSLRAHYRGTQDIRYVPLLGLSASRLVLSFYSELLVRAASILYFAALRRCDQQRLAGNELNGLKKIQTIPDERGNYLSIAGYYCRTAAASREECEWLILGSGCMYSGFQRPSFVTYLLELFQSFLTTKFGLLAVTRGPPVGKAYRHGLRGYIHVHM